jgi:hypothetical protein
MTSITIEARLLCIAHSGHVGTVESRRAPQAWHTGVDPLIEFARVSMQYGCAPSKAVTLAEEALEADRQAELCASDLQGK